MYVQSDFNVCTYTAHFVYVAGEHQVEVLCVYTALELTVHQHPSKNTPGRKLPDHGSMKFHEVVSANTGKQGGNDILTFTIMVPHPTVTCWWWHTLLVMTHLCWYAYILHSYKSVFILYHNMILSSVTAVDANRWWQKCICNTIKCASHDKMHHTHNHVYEKLGVSWKATQWPPLVHNFNSASPFHLGTGAVTMSMHWLRHNSYYSYCWHAPALAVMHSIILPHLAFDVHVNQRGRQEQEDTGMPQV